MGQLKDSSTSMCAQTITIKGAREHNLKNLDVTIPRDKLIVITGLSGSGKSSLAFDTIYAEGQRRYVESLSAYARQFLELMQKPDVDSIDGLSPAISIEQKTTSKNPRSTVATVTEIYDYMRLLWARVGVPYSPETGLPIESQTVSQMVDRILELKEGTRLYLLAPIARGRKGEYRKELEDARRKGYQRVKINGEFYEIEDAPKLDKKYKHSIDIVVDRLAVRPEISARLADSIETALSLTDGLCTAEFADGGAPLIFSSKFACPVSGFTIEEIEPRLFSFNSPFGACPICDGLGFEQVFDPDLVVPNSSLSLSTGAIAPWGESTSRMYLQTLEALSKHYNFSMTRPWEELCQKAKDIVLYGSGKDKVQIRYGDSGHRREVNRPYEGVIPSLRRRYRETDSQWIRDEFSKYLTSQQCKTCSSQRLRPEALAVKLNGLTISDATAFSIAEAAKWFIELPKSLTQKQSDIATRILKEIDERLGFLNSVGLNYLTLNRASGTLSGGESQRIRLASQIGSGLTGVLFVLDEPSIGLHQRDNERLLKTLTQLRDLGNTVIVVEHDEDTIRQADYILDIGPGAGIHGGEIVALGDAAAIMRHERSLTGQYLSGARKIPVPDTRRSGDSEIRIVEATGNNLCAVTVSLPLRTFVCITGVSGGGKSSLIIETLFKSASKALMGTRVRPAPHKAIEGLHQLDKVIEINQSPIGRTPRSNPATYTGAFGPIRDWFSGLPESKARGYAPGRFSFNVKGGRCEACQGDGLIKIEMHFLPDVYVTCDLCKGARYNRETLEVRFKGQSIADILNMTVTEGADFFSAVPSVCSKLNMLKEVGLGYIKIGQQATTLSGGEAQRIKLAKELARRATGRTLYILDEPTTGLHFEDTRKLLEVLQRLVDQGNSIFVIEHNLDVIKTADWIVDMGPEGGSGGGKVVAEGTPESIVQVKNSHTGRFLKPLLTR